MVFESIAKFWALLEGFEIKCKILKSIPDSKSLKGVLRLFENIEDKISRHFTGFANILGFSEKKKLKFQNIFFE